MIWYWADSMFYVLYAMQANLGDVDEDRVDAPCQDPRFLVDRATIDAVDSGPATENCIGLSRAGLLLALSLGFNLAVGDDCGVVARK